MEAQQFHLKWNNHSLNTLSSFQHLLDTNCLVDVSLTCASGKIVPAHRMVLAACSDYFYTLFKDLPEKHPVIVFKDASEQILQDLLEFMYRGEVEVDESNLSDFLKFADTLQVKGLSQSDSQNWRGKEEPDVSSTARGLLPLAGLPNGAVSTPSNTPPMPTAKDVSKLLGSLPEPVASMNKSAYQFTNALAGYPAKFPSFFPGLPNGENIANDLYSHLASPNLFNALKRKYPVALGQKIPGFVDPDSPVLKMPFLKDYFGKHPLDLSLSESGRLSAGYGSIKDEDSDDIAEHSPPPSELLENGQPEMDGMSRNDSPAGEKLSPGGGPSSRKPQGRGSRLERMIAAEYKILSEYSEAQGQPGANPEVLPAITPELMKSRRTHSLQLAIGEILHNRASVQSAATKYHIPRETLRRHYQRYLKAMGIQKQEGPSSNNVNVNRIPSTPTKHSSLETLAAVTATAASNDESSNGYSSLLDIGQAYGIWTPGEDNSNDITGPRDLKIVEDEEDSPTIDVTSNDKDKLSDDTQEDKVESSTPPIMLGSKREPQNNNNISVEKNNLVIGSTPVISHSVLPPSIPLPSSHSTPLVQAMATARIQPMETV